MTEPLAITQKWTAPWALIAVLAAVFCVLSVLAGSIGTLPGDLAMTEWVQDATGGIPKTFATIGNAIGSTAWTIGLFTILVGGAAWYRSWRDVWFLLAADVMRLLAMALKGIIQSPRPTDAQAILHGTFDGYGFPSGHTLTSTLLFGGLAFIAVRHVQRSWVIPAAFLMWAIGALMTAFARVWSGAHWTSDVIGGMVLGVAIILIAANASAWMMERDRMRDRITP
ncbi:MAG: phosphatase PAP2 family protein [Thermomicrobiales bacterium]